MLIYSDTETPNERGFNGFNPLKCDAVKCWLKHFENSLMLQFFIMNGTMKEKHEASKELNICNRKMEYWKRQPHFNQNDASNSAQKLKQQWEMKR